MKIKGVRRTKAVAAKIKAAGEQDGLPLGQFTAYASVFGNVDSYGDVVVKGAFADSLKAWAAADAPIPVYWSHLMSADPEMNLGHVLQASEDDHGLLVTAQLDIENNPKAAYVYQLLKGRRVQQMSFAYDIEDAEPVKAAGDEEDPDGDAEDDMFATGLTLKRLKLHEVSVVPIGANQETEVLEVKTIASTARRVAGGVKAGRVLSEKNLTSLRDARDALDDVIKTAERNDDQEKASGTGRVRDEGAAGVKSARPRPTPSADHWATELSILELEGVPR